MGKGGRTVAKAQKVANDMLVEIFNDILNIEENAMQYMGYEDVTMTEVHTIEAIGRETSKTMGKVAERLDITVGTLTTAINRLVKKGYVERHRDEGDRRIVLIQLTEKGRVVFDAHESFHEEMIENLLKDVNLTDDCELIRAMANLREFFKAKRHEICHK
jgi:DNA-binding MarR family transcriptional regulator